MAVLWVSPTYMWTRTLTLKTRNQALEFSRVLSGVPHLFYWFSWGSQESLAAHQSRGTFCRNVLTQSGSWVPEMVKYNSGNFTLVSISQPIWSLKGASSLIIKVFHLPSFPPASLPAQLRVMDSSPFQVPCPFRYITLVMQTFLGVHAVLSLWPSYHHPLALWLYHENEKQCSLLKSFYTCEIYPCLFSDLTLRNPLTFKQSLFPMTGIDHKGWYRSLCSWKGGIPSGHLFSISVRFFRFL